MTKRIIAFTAVIIFALLSGISVSADMGPKPSIDLTVLNAPDENYYIDLLYSKDWHPSLEDAEIKNEIENAASESDREMMRTIVGYVSEDGMTARLGCPISKPFLHSNSGGKYSFIYSSIPHKFRVIIVTESGRTIVSGVCETSAYNAEVTYDLQTGELTEKAWGSIKPMIGRFVFTFLVTLLVEGFFFLLDKYRFSDGKNLAVFLLTNLFTQLGLYLGIETFGLMFAFAELGVIAVEAVIYSLLLTPKNPKKASIYAVIANLMSLILSTPAWLLAFFIIRK